jgi:S1-C subfamily serine protease
MSLVEEEERSGRVSLLTIDKLHQLAKRLTNEEIGSPEMLATCYLKIGNSGDGYGYYKYAMHLRSRRAPLSKVAEFLGMGANLGDLESMYALSSILKKGEGVMKNYQDSFEWLLKSAYKSSKRAMEEIGDAYMSGEIVTANPVEGLAWYLIAKQSGKYDLGKKIQNLEVVLPADIQIAAQNRAKQINSAIESGTRASPQPDTAGHVPSAPLPSKPSTPPKGSGSGSIVSPAGHVVTAAHVIKGANHIEVVTPTGTHSAKVLFNDEANDLAVLKIEQSFQKHLNVLHSRSIRLGAKVSTIGFPNIGLQGHSPKATEGVISSDHGFQNDVRMWQVSVPIQPGNSGGPLLDESGHVVGVVVASLSLNAVKITGAVPQNVNYAIKSAYLEPMLGSCQVDLVQTPSTEPKKLEEVMESARHSSVLILTY